MIDVLLGLQWGDEGKGKIADYLTPKYKVVARFQGGPNAGHSISFGGKSHVLNTIPSGIFHEECTNVIGSGVVIDPVRLMEEIARVEAQGPDVKKNLKISQKAHLILPTHKLLDKASESAKGQTKIGSTLRGIGPTYRDKIGRTGLRVGEIFLPDFNARYKKAIDRHLALLAYYNFDYNLEEWEKEFFEAVEKLRGYTFVNSEYLINEQIKNQTEILAEGAQGSMLDIDFGSYPFVTSSNTISGGSCNGLGVSPRHIRKVTGIFKAYCTRVGEGPFPTELNDDTGQFLRDSGHEYGATTGRPRRCGWLDLVALKYAIMLSGVDELIMMKSDVLSGLDTLKVATAYKHNGELTEEVPFDICSGEIIPQYTEYGGWSENIMEIKDYNALPTNLHQYINSLEDLLSVPIKIVSIGPERRQTIFK